MATAVQDRITSAPSADKVRSDVNWTHLLESLVCDVHWTALHAATISYLVQASCSRGMDLRLGAWRHLLQDNTRISQLGLRYSHDLAIDFQTRTQIGSFLEHVSAAMVATHGVLKKSGTHHALTRRELQPLQAPWSAASTMAGVALAALDQATRGRLTGEYAENCRIIIAFLREAATGDGSRLNEWGELSLPALAQRRLHPRTLLDRACRLIIGGQTIPAILHDASRNGFGVTCREPLAQRTSIIIELEDGRRLQAKVARTQGSVTGIHLTTPLSLSDPLFRPAG